MKKTKKIAAITLVMMIIVSMLSSITAFAAAPAWPLIKQGSTDKANVYAIQYLINNAGYSSISVDGGFGSGTVTAVSTFQSKKGLSADGQVGANTWKALVVTQSTNSYSVNATKAIQHLLNNKHAAGPALSVDGVFGSGTKDMVMRFQKAVGISQDGIVGATTWQYLVGSTTPVSGGTTTTGYIRPIRASFADVSGGSRYFGAARSNGRAHAAIDFVCAAGSSVYASTSGTVTGYYSFYQNTYALEVKNDDGTVLRYSEISSSLRAGDRVNKGSVIGTVIKNNDGTAMLHLEYYKGTASGGLTQTSNTTYTYVTKRNYCRRSDLLDPTFFATLPTT